MPDFKTLNDALRSAAVNSADNKGYVFLSNREPKHISYRELWDRATEFAGKLQHQGVKHGDRILIVIQTSADFAEAFYGSTLCGALPCVVASPSNYATAEEGIQRIRNISNHLQATLIITREQEKDLCSTADLSAKIITVEQVRGTPSRELRQSSIDADSVAFIQATSGSTGRPKCVVLRHRNVLANLEQIGRRLKVGEDVVVSWLPLFHDMGLVGCFLFSLYWQLKGVFLPSSTFLKRPVSWLRAISDYRGTLSPAPNFSYALAASRTKENDVAELNLSSWRAVMCGAEPVEVQTLRRFTDRFQSTGLRSETLVPCYGMAETTLAVSMHPVGEPLRSERISYTALREHGRAVSETLADDDKLVEVCDCGPAVDGTRLRIVDESGFDLPDGSIGHIWISGPSVMLGYYGDLEKTAQAFQGDWIDSGDLGYLREGRLFITGRAKDVIIIRGQKYQPSDFEQAAATVPGISRGRVVAFGVVDELLSTEGLYVVSEYPESTDLGAGEIQEKIIVAVSAQTGVYPAHVGFVPRHSVPRTTSGKLQRGQAKKLYLDFVRSSSANQHEVHA
jgi:acyl-CoA synthetase (AMP-forming)/AMP-acid ligase II